MKNFTGKVSSLLLLKVSQLLFFTIIIVIISALQYNKCVEGLPAACAGSQKKL